MGLDELLKDELSSHQRRAIIEAFYYWSTRGGEQETTNEKIRRLFDKLGNDKTALAYGLAYIKQRLEETYHVDGWGKDTYISIRDIVGKRANILLDLFDNDIMYKRELEAFKELEEGELPF